MRVKRSIAITDPTTIRIDRTTKRLLEQSFERNDTFNTMLKRRFGGRFA